jgi:CO/xanthine dehydrogenase Mo-binding subunit
MAAAAGWLGRSIERVEDATLLTGRGRYIDDLGVPPGTLHAAILRSSHAHADIRAIRTAAAAAAPGVAAVIIGREVAALSTPLVPVLHAPTEQSKEAPRPSARSARPTLREDEDEVTGSWPGRKFAISASRPAGRFAHPAEQSLK